MWFKAQLYQESRFDELAVSPVGAAGVGQIMPGTWQELIVRMQLAENASVFDPELNIKASAYYMRRQINIWTSPRPAEDRLFLAMSSYNAGAGNIISAQALCDGALLYQQIIRCLPDVTGEHSKETIDYVAKINRFYFRFRFEP